ncbi:MAG: sensor histidine kinase [Anaerolineae bacterium]
MDRVDCPDAQPSLAHDHVIGPDEERGMPAYDLVGLLSHEIRSPLAVIIACTELLLDEDLNVAEREELLRSVQSQARQLGRLMENLLDAERLVQGAFEVQREPLTLGSLVRRTISALEARADGHPISLSLPQHLPFVWGDETMVEIVLANLLSNAIKYSAPGSSIHVHIEASSAHEVVVSVRDEGVGIPPDQAEHVFGRFRRGTSLGSHKQPGHGLGLYISQVFVEAQGGRIWLESEPGAGSTFFFSLPRLQEE